MHYTQEVKYTGYKVIQVAIPSVLLTQALIREAVLNCIPVFLIRSEYVNDSKDTSLQPIRLPVEVIVNF